MSTITTAQTSPSESISSLEYVTLNGTPISTFVDPFDETTEQLQSENVELVLVQNNYASQQDDVLLKRLKQLIQFADNNVDLGICYQSLTILQSLEVLTILASRQQESVYSNDDFRTAVNDISSFIIGTLASANTPLLRIITEFFKCYGEITEKSLKSTAKNKDQFVKVIAATGDNVVFLLLRLRCQSVPTETSANLVANGTSGDASIELELEFCVHSVRIPKAKLLNDHCFERILAIMPEHLAMTTGDTRSYFFQRLNLARKHAVEINNLLLMPITPI
jgi:hypothetical protein